MTQAVMMSRASNITEVKCHNSIKNRNTSNPYMRTLLKIIKCAYNKAIKAKTNHINFRSRAIASINKVMHRIKPFKAESIWP